VLTATFGAGLLVFTTSCSSSSSPGAVDAGDDASAQDAATASDSGSGGADAGDASPGASALDVNSGQGTVTYQGIDAEFTLDLQ
jgi:hypothetical protein